MPISENQLETWAKSGAAVTALSTHESTRLALSSYEPIRCRNYEVYLQGSYRNSTNIRGDSDVDVVVQLNSAFCRDISGLSAHEQELYLREHSPVTYTWEDFRSDVVGALLSYYGRQNVEEGNKSLKLKKASGRLTADIVPCIQYRRYQRYGVNGERFIEGMAFRTRNENRFVVNYPKVHYCNGAAKNSQDRTCGRYKPVVRMFKNARGRLMELNMLSLSSAPSYLLECLLYNVPDGYLWSDLRGSFCNVIDWLQSANLNSFVCQNEQLPLFGPEPEQWSVADARATIDALMYLWRYS